MRPDECLELADEVGMAPSGEIAIDALFDPREPQRFQTRDVGLREALIGEVGERDTAPEREGIVEASFLLQALRALEIELVGFDAQEVAGRARHEPLLAEQLAELRHVYLQRLERGLGRLVFPERLDQAISRDDAVRVQEQHRQQRTLLLPTQLE